MSTIVDIRSSLTARIAELTELTEELATLQAALDALGTDNGVLVEAIVVTDQESPDLEYNRAVVHAERMAMEEAKHEHPTSIRKRDRLYELLRHKYVSEIGSEDSGETVASPEPLPNRERMVKSTRHTNKSAAQVRGSRANQILTLSDMGWTAQEIADETGAHPNYVYTVIRKDKDNQ
jgi:septal ring factor EnvC (AmiA/AmiB activator)